MRLFAALELPRTMLDALAASVPAAPAGASRVPPERWHLTLAFYGEVDAAKARRIAEDLPRRLVPGPAVRLRAAGGGVFRGGAAHVALTGDTASDDARLRAAAAACTAAAGSARRPRFRPHVTVARFRHGPPPPGYLEGLREVVGGPWSCSDVVLMESFLGPDPRYEVRGTFRLTG